jgi:hypothetical protein
MGQSAAETNETNQSQRTRWRRRNIFDGGARSDAALL